jgi:phage shock protein PspC (stress-responsive transcriptional regulator)
MTEDPPTDPRTPPEPTSAPAPGRPLTRAADGRWLGGVCAGLAAARRGERPLSALWPRLAFVALAGLGGIGVVLYLACWLILPGPPGADERRGPRGVVVLARACAAGIGLIALALVGATATVFGFGWYVFAAGAAALVGTLGVRRLGPGWSLLPVLALTVPGAALAAGGVQLAPRTGESVVRIASTAGLSRHTYRSGLDSLLLDLRHTPLPATGRLTLHVRAGVRRTIVALPADRCVHVVVHQHIDPLPVRVASLLSGRQDDAYASVWAFGRVYSGQTDGTEQGGVRGRGPRLTVDFASMGGSLFVRDYPRGIDPDTEPDWPGYPVGIEARPITRGVPRRAARRLVAAWRSRRRRELAARARYRRLVSGPCARR